MEPSNTTEIHLTDELINYIRRSTIKIALNRVPRYIDLEDVVQHVLLSFVSQPPTFDASRGATLKTFVYFIINRIVGKLAGSMESGLGREQRFEPLLHGGYYHADQPNFDEPLFMDFIDCEETRRLCLLMLEHDANVCEVARHLDVAEGTVRKRLKILRGRLRTAGFDPFAEVP